MRRVPWLVLVTLLLPAALLVAAQDAAMGVESEQEVCMMIGARCSQRNFWEMLGQGMSRHAYCAPVFAFPAC